MDKKIKIAIDNGPLKGGDTIRGIGFHTKHLIEGFKNNKEIDYELVDAQNTNLSRYNLVHFQKFNPFKLSFPIKKQIKSVITIHDLIPLVYPKAYPSGIKGKIIFEFQKLLIRQMDAIITISETSKKDICRLLGVSPSKVHVIYLAAGKEFKHLPSGEWMSKIRKKYTLPEKFVLYVGDVNYNKNISTLAEACKIAKIHLVIVGKQATETEFNLRHIENRSFVRFLEKYGKDKEIKRIGYLEDEDLVKIYNLATLYCQPSYYEGFGIPILEAFSTGTPVVAAKNNCHVEIGGNAVLLADPKSAQDLAQKITEVLEDNFLKENLVKNGYSRAKNFSWEKTVKKTFQVYQKITNSSK
ncbi:MAG: glycosyltransferase family 1 protein [Patescibacteria group bacterium]